MFFFVVFGQRAKRQAQLTLCETMGMPVLLSRSVHWSIECTIDDSADEGKWKTAAAKRDNTISMRLSFRICVKVIDNRVSFSVRSIVVSVPVDFEISVESTDTSSDALRLFTKTYLKRNFRGIFLTNVTQFNRNKTARGHENVSFEENNKGSTKQTRAPHSGATQNTKTFTRQPLWMAWFVWDVCLACAEAQPDGACLQWAQQWARQRKPRRKFVKTRDERLCWLFNFTRFGRRLRNWTTFNVECIANSLRKQWTLCELIIFSNLWWIMGDSLREDYPHYVEGAIYQRDFRGGIFNVASNAEEVAIRRRWRGD